MRERSLRIAHLALTSLPRSVGGLEVVVDNLITSQRDAGHDVTLVTRWQQGRAARSAGLPYRVASLPPNPRGRAEPFREIGPRWPTSLGIRAIQARWRFDVWHAHWVYPTAWLAAPTLHAMGVPLIATAHGADVEVDTAAGHGFRQFEHNDRRVRAFVPTLGYLTAVSPTIRDRLVELGASQRAVSVIPNGVDLKRFGASPTTVAEVRARYGVPPGRKLVLTVGASRPAKGHRFIGPAFDSLIRMGYDITWLVLGGDPVVVRAGSSGRQSTDELRALPSVPSAPHSKAPADDVIGLYRAADVVVMPSVSEGFGLAALEAMAAGTPLVVSDIPALRALAGNGSNAVLVPPSDADAIARAVSRLLSDPGLGSRLVESAGDVARSHNLEVISGRYVDVYRQAILEEER